MSRNVKWSGDGFSSSQSTSFPSGDPDFKSVTDNFNSNVRWAVAASIISMVIGAVALVAIVLAIIDCLKKAGKAIPTYSRISQSDDTSKRVISSGAAADSTTDTVAVTIPPNFPVITDSQFEAATVERFIIDMAKEKPIRFSPQQLKGFTKNYTMSKESFRMERNSLSRS